ncbi:ankyrin repeat domain-containing protein [Lutimaribacter marinistellae]|uniref:Ankyrin repeat domain-containing protein n=1 Tax=Lutimaribacter marinistellae TaxID=1820329 RepID=A0ABV7TIH1_9RHOB
MWRIVAKFLGLLFLFKAAHAGPLFDAAEMGETTTVRALLESGASVDERGPNAATPLIVAALAGKSETAAVLVDAGADVMARNRSGFTPLHAAAYGGQIDVARLLMANGADINANTNRAGKTPIYMAADEGHIDVVKLLLAEGADVSNVDKSGFTVLIRAMFRKRYDVVSVLKNHGARCPPPEAFGDEFHRACEQAGE